MNDLKIVDNLNVVYKESGEMPEDFKAYLVIWKTDDGEVCNMFGVFEPDYDNGRGGFYDGMMGHLELEYVYAWVDLENLKIVKK